MSMRFLHEPEGNALLATLSAFGQSFSVTESLPGSRSWSEVTEFVRDRFNRHYGARPDISMTRLLSLRDDAGTVQAAVGIRGASDTSLFLEHYLDAPIESYIGQHANQAMTRSSIMEIGHLAGGGAGKSRLLFVALTALLTRWHYQWIAFTGTREVRNIFRALQLAPQSIAVADPGRLADAGSSWGSYYAHAPEVMIGEIKGGHATLRDSGCYQSLDLRLFTEVAHAVA